MLAGPSKRFKSFDIASKWEEHHAQVTFARPDLLRFRTLETIGVHPCAFYLFIRQPHGSEVSPAARNTLDSARIPRASKLLICGLFLKGRVLAQDGASYAAVAPASILGLLMEQRDPQPSVMSRYSGRVLEWRSGTPRWRPANPAIDSPRPRCETGSHRGELPNDRTSRPCLACLS